MDVLLPQARANPSRMQPNPDKENLGVHLWSIAQPKFERLMLFPVGAYWANAPLAKSSINPMGLIKPPITAAQSNQGVQIHKSPPLQPHRVLT